MSDQRSYVRVWDPLVRLGHWTLVVAFLTASLTEGKPEDVHVVAGYAVGVYVVVRTIWGFVGSRHARFADFVRGPREVVADLASVARGDRVRHLGHNPAGGAMIVALLFCLAATALLGLATYADAENKGPLAPWLGDDRPAVIRPPGVTPAPIDAMRKYDAKRGEYRDDDDVEEQESPFAQWHERFANLTLVLVLLHVLGVIADSLMHRENLVRAMFTGRKVVATDQVPGIGRAPRQGP